MRPTPIAQAVADVYGFYRPRLHATYWVSSWNLLYTLEELKKQGRRLKIQEKAPEADKYNGVQPNSKVI